MEKRRLNYTNHRTMYEVTKGETWNDLFYLVEDNFGNEKWFKWTEREDAIDELYKAGAIVTDDQENEVVEVEQDDTFKNNTKMKIAKKYAYMLAEIDDEGRDSGIWAYAKDGYMFAAMGGHTAHEYNQKDLHKVIRTLVPCECNECQAEKMEGVK